MVAGMERAAGDSVEPELTVAPAKPGKGGGGKTPRNIFLRESRAAGEEQ